MLRLHYILLVREDTINVMHVRYWDFSKSLFQTGYTFVYINYKKAIYTYSHIICYIRLVI